MAQRVQFSWWRDLAWQERTAIDQNAAELDSVQTDVSTLHRLVRKQADDILVLRAFVIGLVDVLHEKAPFDQAELDAAVAKAWAELNPPPPPPDPTANIPVARKRDEHPVTCTKCGKSVPAYRTNITAAGEVCDACS